MFQSLRRFTRKVRATSQKLSTKNLLTERQLFKLKQLTLVHFSGTLEKVTLKPCKNA